MRFTGDSDTRSGYTYVGEWWAQAVSAYPTTNRRNRGPVCQTQEVRFAEGMTVDRSGTLYVAGHLLRSAGVATFGPNCGGAGASFVDPTDSPQDPVVDGATLYLTTIDDGSQAASIFVYNLTTGPEPMRQLTDPNAGLGIGVR
jgi:sugar lactone lactonase YvrE